MDEQRFDEVVKHLASTSRRQILNGLLGGLAAAVGMQGVDAARKRQKQQNNTEGRNKSDRKQEVRAAAKGKGKKCGGLVCEAGTTCVSGGSKPVCCPNARVCGQVCLSAPCGEGHICCGDSCVPNTTTANCGTCGNVCSTGQTCINGTCTSTICPTEPQGCCSCFYQDTTTGNFISACQVTNGCPSCNDFCQANVPPGATQIGQGTACSTSSPFPQSYSCRSIENPSQPEYTGEDCAGTPCVPAGT
jgi:hypothetical protein